MTRLPREPLADALRALALAGVLAVNAQSYTTGPWGTPLGVPLPGDSALSALAHAAVAAVFQGKAYPLLAFLFGYAFALSARERGPGFAAHRLGRTGRLLLLGLAHGLLVFSGDILTAYALCGVVLLNAADWRLRTLRRACLATATLALLMWALLAAASWAGGLAGADAAPLPGYAQAAGLGSFVGINAQAFLQGLWGTLTVLMPELLALMFAGALAARLRLLRHRRWRAPAQRWVARAALPLVLLNLAYGAVVWRVAPGGEAALWPWVALTMPLGWASAAAVLAWGVSHGAGPGGALARLVPLGRYTLSLYLSLSLACAVLFSGAGLGWPMHSVGLLALSLILWTAALVVAPHLSARGWRGPFETWVSGRRSPALRSPVDPRS